MSSYENVVKNGILPALIIETGADKRNIGVSEDALELEAYRLAGRIEQRKGMSVYALLNKEYQSRGLAFEEDHPEVDASFGMEVKNAIAVTPGSLIHPDDIEMGMAKAIWASSWAQAEEEEGRTHGGHEITEIMPEVPSEAIRDAYRLAGYIEEASGVSISELFQRAVNADQIDPEMVSQEYEESFGHYLAMEGLGHGVSWFDDHEKFDLNIPYSFDALFTESKAYDCAVGANAPENPRSNEASGLSLG